MSVLFHSRQKFKQERILDKVHELVTEYDKHVALLKEEKIKLSVDVKFLEIFMLVLHQELLVVRSYSEQETNVTEQLSAKLKEKHGRLLKVGTRLILNIDSAKRQNILPVCFACKLPQILSLLIHTCHLRSFNYEVSFVLYLTSLKSLFCILSDL